MNLCTVIGSLFFLFINQDMYASANGLPSADAANDLELLSSSKADESRQSHSRGKSLHVTAETTVS